MISWLTLFEEIIAVCSENRTKYKYKMQTYWLLKQVVHVVPTGLSVVTTESYKNASYLLCPVGLYACLSACNNSKTAERILMKFGIGEFYWNLSIFYNFGSNRTTMTETLHEDLPAFLRAEVTRRGIPSHPRNQMGEFSVATSSPSQTPRSQVVYSQTTLTSLRPFAKIRGQIVANASKLLAARIFPDVFQ
jgi:hypothetical protein